MVVTDSLDAAFVFDKMHVVQVGSSPEHGASWLPVRSGGLLTDGAPAKRGIRAPV